MTNIFYDENDIEDFEEFIKFYNLKYTEVNDDEEEMIEDNDEDDIEELYF